MALVCEQDNVTEVKERYLKTSIKKTRKGAVLKLVRECYLRDDISCGVEKCTKCESNYTSSKLSDLPIIESTLCPYPHYIVPDVSVALHQVDFLEDSAINNVIILQTVLQAVRQERITVYKRIRNAVSNPDKNFYVFSNEHHKETYLRESSNGFSDSVRKSVEWYSTHFEKARIEAKAVLLTGDEDNKKKATDANITAYTVFEYAEALVDCPGIVDKLSKNSEIPSEKSQIIFPEHLSLSKVLAGIKSKKYFQGTFQASRENYLEGSISVEIDGIERWVLIQGLQNLNRAVHGDTVAVEILPETEWSLPSGVVTDKEAEDTVVEKVDDKILKPVAVKESNLQVTGKVVGIVRRNWKTYCGTLLPLPDMRGAHHTFVPANHSIPRIRIETRQGPTLLGQRIIVSIDSWPRSSRFPQGHFVSALGKIGDKDTENEVLLLEHEVPHQPFSLAVLADLPKLPWLITEDDIKKRTDLRHLCICSVDPPGCTDIDDALHYRELDNGNCEVGVHIADVSHFIRPNTAIDREAAERGNTVYLVDKRIDMVPELLSSNLCSLRGGEERFAFSCIWEMTQDAQIVKKHFAKSIIKSRAALTYAEAQAKIDDPKLSDKITLSLRGLNRLAKILKQERMSKGALNLASPEVRFEVDSETHDPTGLATKELKETNSLVEEFMLLANITVALKIHDHFPDCAVLRRHPSPNVSNFDTLIKCAGARNVKLDVVTAKELATSLNKAEIPNQPYFNTLIRILTTRFMMQAVYFSSGTIPEAEFQHYGLATPIYTHFTSPIRRYADLMVHRLLAVAITADKTYPKLLDKHNTQKICNNLNRRHLMAQRASRASIQLHTHLFFKDKVVEEEAYILFVKRNALQVLVPRYGVETMLFLDKKGEMSATVKLDYDEDNSTLLVGRMRFRTFDKIVVQLSVEKSGLQHTKLKLSLVKPAIPSVSVPSIIDEDSTSKPPKKKKKI